MDSNRLELSSEVVQLLQQAPRQAVGEGRAGLCPVRRFGHRLTEWLGPARQRL